MTTNNLNSFEERIQKPGYLLFLVVVLLLLIVGLVDLIDFQAFKPAILGRYGINYFIFLVGYTLFTLAWASLLLRPNDDHLLRGLLDYIQHHPLLAIGVLALIAIVMLAMLNASRTVEHIILSMPAIQATVFIVLLLFAAFILFYKWGDPSRPQRWRKIIVTLIGIVLAVEILIQGLAFLGLLPSVTFTTEHEESYSPYSRIYQSDEGLGNGLANNYGRYAPNFRMLPDSHRIAILGDTFVEGMQVRKEENLGVLLEERLAEVGEDGPVTEILPLGHPDLGPGIYLSNWMLFEMLKYLEPDEAIIMFDTGNDFQTVDRGGTGYPYYVYTGQGKVQLDLTAFVHDLHGAEHNVYRGYEGFQPLLFLKSNYLTPRLLWEQVAEPYLKGPDVLASELTTPTGYEIDLPNGFVFNPRTNKNAARIASAQINMANQQLKTAGLDVRLVTIPTFTEAFYKQQQWNTAFGNSDLLLPERELRETAAAYGIPFLGLGAYMDAQGMTPADVQALYFNDGLGHFTPAGHQFVANALYQCFFAQTVPPEAGCDLATE